MKIENKEQRILPDLKSSASKIAKYSIIALGLQYISHQTHHPGVGTQPDMSPVLTGWAGLQGSLKPMDVNKVDYRLGPCDACPLPIPGSPLIKYPEIKLTSKKGEEVSVWGGQCLETAQEAQGLLNLRITNELVSDDWLYLFLNEAGSKGVDMNQLVISNKNGGKKSVLYYTLEKGFRKSLDVLCKSTSFNFALDQGLRNDNGLLIQTALQLAIQQSDVETLSKLPDAAFISDDGQAIVRLIENSLDPQLLLRFDMKLLSQEWLPKALISIINNKLKTTRMAYLEHFISGRISPVTLNLALNTTVNLTINGEPHLITPKKIADKLNAPDVILLIKEFIHNNTLMKN